MVKKISSALLLAAMLVGCNKTEVKDGVKINIVSHDSNAKKLKEGDIITFNLEIKTGSDSLLNSTYKDGKPQNFQVLPKDTSKTGYKGRFENSFNLLSVGDSAVVYVSVDSLAKMSPLPPFLKKGTDIKFFVKILKAQTQAEFQKDMEKEAVKAKAAAVKRLADAPSLISAYVAKRKMSFTTSKSGLVYSISGTGTGAAAQKGDNCKINYIGKFTDDRIFDQNKGVEFPVAGAIEGFMEAMTLMKKGQKGTFIIPPALGYGEQDNAKIPGNSVLVFELDMLDVTKPSAAPQGMMPPQGH
ncbi:MAG: FKBP-type peptidyl-prolyl cis-trans isomerase [Pseudarcicella sp.]|jgi:FKBP-type peptidyl-prolyl cis-trans isomerase|nr:FKBP-type peptidyl-prolyl cis-trans isomerase [Pseudarcicella sp.]MBP6410603.1 FKBP-type peptidyl-prolyl cis-trans isomerase [Pseudarcicella sp.]